MTKTIKITEEVHKELKVFAAESSTNIEIVASEAIKKHIQQQRKAFSERRKSSIKKAS